MKFDRLWFEERPALARTKCPNRLERFGLHPSDPDRDWRLDFLKSKTLADGNTSPYQTARVIIKPGNRYVSVCLFGVSSRYSRARTLLALAPVRDRMGTVAVVPN